MPHTLPLSAPAAQRVAILGAPEARQAWLEARSPSDPPILPLDIHDPREALAAADLVVVLHGSCVEQTGTPEEIFHHPVNERVLGLLGPVNAFRGRLEFRSRQDGGSPVFCSLAGEPARVLANWLSPAFEPEAGVTFLVRPQDLEVLTEAPPVSRTPGPHAPARITRIYRTGPRIQLTLVGDGGELWSAELAHEEELQRPLDPGQRVYLRARAAYVFPVDYQI